MYTQKQFELILDLLKQKDMKLCEQLLGEKLETVNDWLLEREDLRDKLWDIYSSAVHGFFVDSLTFKRGKGWLLKLSIPEELEIIRNNYKLKLTVDLSGYQSSLLQLRDDLLECQNKLPIDGQDSEKEDIIASIEQLKKEAAHFATTPDIEFDGLVRTSAYVDDPKNNLTKTVITFSIPKETVNILNDKMKELSGFRISLI